MRLLPLIAALTLGSAAAALAQQPHLSIATANGQTSFHLGERIPLTLTFTGTSADNVNTSSYDRSGRSSMDTYSIAPSTGWSDPLAEYFARGIFDAGGMFTVLTLEKPFHITRELNEWIRFDQPGDYTVTAVSGRVSRSKNPGWGNDNAPALLSQALKLHIVAATPEWQQSTLDRILQALATPPKPRPIGEEESDPRYQALIDLRYLASPASVPVLASHLREDEDIRNGSFLATVGLYGLPPSLHDAAIASLNRLLEEPAFPITNSFVSTLSGLQRPSNEPDPPGLHWLDEESPPDRARFNATWRLAVAALSRKQGNALAVSAATLLAWTPPNPSQQDLALLGAILRGNFLHLSTELQTSALQDNWDHIRSPALLPVLRTIASAPRPVYESYAGSQLHTIAVKRWYELDPDAALREILTQIGSADPRLSSGELDFLPVQSLTQFESLWAAPLSDKDTNYRVRARLAGLMTRFGTGSQGAQVNALLARDVETEDCDSQAAELAYLVRFDPEAAAPLLARAVAARDENQNGCRHGLFTTIARYASGPALTHAAAEALSDSDIQIVNDAVKYLTHYGDDSARQPLLDRYQKWTAAWAGRAADLDKRSDFENDPEPDQLDRELGPLLGNALLANQGWLPDKQLKAAVLKTCVGNMCKELAQTVHTDRFVGPDFRSSGQTFVVAQFEPPTRDLVEAKIAQYPEGTAFKLSTPQPDNSDTQNTRQFLRDVLARHKMVIAPSPPPQSVPSSAVANPTSDLE